MLSLIRDRYLRIDARSLGLFRIGLALTLLGDLLHRWDWIAAFYSNDGVLPNHNHLFNQHGSSVWSIYHSFSSLDENEFAFAVNLIIYLFFLFGWQTRVFHVLSLICLVSLTGRNVLLESPGNSVAIALVAITALLPLGARFSADSLQRSFAERDERDAEELNDRSKPANPRTPASLAALAALLVVGLMLLFAGLTQTGQTWSEGTALYYALHVDRWTGAVGVAVRDSLPAGVLAAWTKVMKVAELGVLALMLVPVARRLVRAAAMALLGFYALTFVVLFTYGLYGWSLLAAVALLIPEESWDAMRKGTRKVRLWYDDDCGICLWAARLLKRLDLRHNIEFFPTSGEESYPKGVTLTMTDRSMVAVGPDGVPRTEALALSEIVRSLPLVWPFGWLLRVPGIRQFASWLYRKIADNRIDISVAFGLGACGVESEEESSAAPADEQAPGQILWRRTKMVTQSALALAMLLAFLAQSEQKNTLPVSTGLGKLHFLTAAASWSRMMAAWGVWAPDPPRENATLVVDAETRSGWMVDVLTGYEPDLELQNPRRARKGILWAEYTDHIRQQANEPYRQEFQRYLSRGGYAVDTKTPGNYIQKYSALWLSVPTPPPGQPRSGEIDQQVIFGQQGRPPTTTPRGEPDPKDRLPLRRIPPMKMR